MTTSNFDVLVVGAGSAGLTAAIGLARAGFAVAVVEAAAFPGAENWSGCVYFCETLAHPDILGPEGVEALAWERRVVERGTFATDGHGLLGVTYRDADAFKHCYTVLRPIFDHHLAQVAIKLGVALLTETTAESLIRDQGKVVGVSTQRGPLYADLTFLAEGDASHLVTREGYERFTDQREAPKFLQGIKQVIELPPGRIEETFGVGPEEGVAYEILLRNGRLRGESSRLNMAGFVYANRQSLSVGLVLPAENLRDHFGGDPNLLTEWFENLPALQPWLRDGRRGAYGAKIIRGGGAKDIPRLIDDGLAIGGAASAIGIDLPYPNFTGPATFMGLLITQAARKIREAKTGFTQASLKTHYLEPLQQSRPWHDVEFLRRWPAYVKRTSVFFGPNLDLALGSAYVWGRSGDWLLTRWFRWLRVLWRSAGYWADLRADAKHLSRALRLRDVLHLPGWGRLLLDGAVNALRDLFGSPRAHLPAAGELKLHYSVGGGAEPVGQAPRLLRRWFTRFKPVMASAARRIYTNNDEPVEHKLSGALSLLIRQINLLDAFAAGTIALGAGVTSVGMLGWDRLVGLFRRRPRAGGSGVVERYVKAARQASDMTPVVASAAQHWEERLSQLAYRTAKASHIHVLWPQNLATKNDVVKEGLWRVCPAHVFEARVSPLQQLQVVVNFENCIKCETCWRTSDLVDWARNGQHGFIYPVHTPATGKLLTAIHEAALTKPTAPAVIDWWQAHLAPLAERLKAEAPGAVNGHAAAELAEVALLLDKLESKLTEYDEALGEEPRTIDRARAEYLECLTRYAQQLAVRAVEVLRTSALADTPHAAVADAYRQLVELAGDLAGRAEERARRAIDQKYGWAAADGRQLRGHQVPGLRNYLGLLGYHGGTPAVADTSADWLQAEEDATTTAAVRATWTARLDSVFSPYAWRDLEKQVPLAPEQDAVVRDLIAQVPAIDPQRLGETLHPPLRKALLAELGSRDPSLAYRVASHLWARDLAGLAVGSSNLSRVARRWARGDEWACFAAVDAVQTPSGSWQGEVLFVPAGGARSLLLLVGGRLVVVGTGPDAPAGLQVAPLASLGLRGAGLAKLRLDQLSVPADEAPLDRDRLTRAWAVLSAADLVSIAAGMARPLCDRAAAHAATRVQFPGLFHDEQARDAIGKFGAIKKMLAEMAARRYLIETVDHNLSPADFSSPSVLQAALVKSVVAEALGSAPGSITYNAGQIFGGTAFSEDDILAKFYRDASAWRFLGPNDVETARHHGEDLLRHWRSDGQRLASLPAEAELFDQLAQRKALQAELDKVRVVRGHLRGIVNDWLAETGRGEGDRPRSLGMRAAAEMGEALARQDAQLLASKALLLRTHARLERGLASEVEVALLRTWLRRASAAFEEFEAGVRRRLARAQQPEPTAAEPTVKPLITFAEYLAAPAAYDSGDFIVKPVNPERPRLVPEMIGIDPALAAVDRRLREQIVGYFGPRGDGLPYERHIEKQHRPSAADLDFCRRHDFFRMTIPEALGGVGRPKVEYYLLTTNTQRFADVAVSLTIQVNTSLGTTPVLLARNYDLPRAQKDLGIFVGDPAAQEEVRSQLTTLRSQMADGHTTAAATTYRAVQSKLEKTVLGSPALRTVGQAFLQAWQGSARAGKETDTAAQLAHIDECLRAWNETCTQAADYHQELIARREACDLFLRWVAAGQISAFALTEPSAGSDTARVGTRAVLRSVPVEKSADGVLTFVPHGGKETRTLIDARKVEFVRVQPPSPVGGGGEGGGVIAPPRSDGYPPPAMGEGEPEGYTPSYRWSPDAPPSPIHFDDYDYETDDPHRLRFYDHGGRRIAFHDIARLRERDGRLWYEYWELTGAKMWITNGRVCGLMCAYAKTDQGVTGFMVDRHAEGLIVGKDEEKLGQCGSPTNEVSLQAVRVPRENVLGLEGRGQVNALETLNVGRAGLAMSAMTQMQGLIEQSRAFAQTAHGELPDWAAWRIERMEDERFTAESLAWEVIGCLDHPEAKSVRMESAIAKALVSESLHRVIALAEQIHGLAGQTEFHLVEKRKRDARVLTIYEGTNEVQRFLLLKDLTALPAAEAPPTSADAPELEATRANFRYRLASALSTFGQGLWQNPNLQANCFLLAEAAAWLKAADSVLGRLSWLQRLPALPTPEANAETGTTSSTQLATSRAAALEVGHRALERCTAEVELRLRRFDDELMRLRHGLYGPEVRAAEMLLTPHHARPTTPIASTITRPLSVLVVIEPSCTAVPSPVIEDGKLREPFWTWTAVDRAALETALRLRDQAASTVHLEVAAVGPRALASVLREALSLGVDRARLVVTPTEQLTADSAAAALAAVLKPDAAYQLVLGGAGEEGVIARLTAATLGIGAVGSTTALAVQHTNDGSDAILRTPEGRKHVRSLPGMVAIEPGLAARPFSTEGYLRGLERVVETERWPRRVEARALTLLPSAAPANVGETTEGPIAPLSASEAAAKFMELLGRSADSAGAPYEGPIVADQPMATSATLAILATEEDGRLLPSAGAVVRAARLLAEMAGGESVVLLVTGTDEGAQRAAVGRLRSMFRGDVVVLAAGEMIATAELRARFLREVWPEKTAAVRFVVGEAWAEPALAALAGRQSGGVIPAVRRLSIEGDHCVLETARAGGKLRAWQSIKPTDDRAWWIALADGAEAEVAPSANRLLALQPEGSVRRAVLPERLTGLADARRLLDELRGAAGVLRLADAEFIIDVGFGVGNRDGYEAVVEPLEKALQDLGVRGLVIGGSRKVTEELHLLPADRQIGQSGVSVAPRVMIALGISGAPQHLNYIGSRAVILAFNRDPEAPLMTLNRRQARPRVLPVVGDLFETVPLLIAALRQEVPVSEPAI
jgi:electron transfer flavoprotein-quinone oxidoreductase